MNTVSTHATAQDSPRAPWYRRPGGLAAALVVTGSFAMWVYAFSGLAAKDPPDTLSDEAYTVAAEAACAPYRATVDALPPAPASRNPLERSDVLAQANDTLDQMLGELRLLSPDNDADRVIVALWLRDWEHYLADRRAYQATLATGEDAKFVLSSPDEVIYTKSMDNLATVNDMPSCATPGDV